MRIEYKYCPNLLIIDTPGLLTPLSRPADRSADRPDAADASLPPGPTEAAQAQQVEQLRAETDGVLGVELLPAGGLFFDVLLRVDRGTL